MPAPQPPSYRMKPTYEYDNHIKLSPDNIVNSQTCPSELDHDELLAVFNHQFVHSGTQLTTMRVVKRERSIVPRGAEGKLIVPNVKLKVRSGSVESAPSSRTLSRRKPWSAGDMREFNKPLPVPLLLSLTLKRPSFETRPWSYDHVVTYPIMKPPPKVEKRTTKTVADGREREVEIVEVYEKPKKLFLFAQKVVLR